MNINNVTLHQGDLMNVLQGIKDNTIDGVITDPPYSSGGGQRISKKPTSKKYCSRGKDTFPDFQGDNKDQRSLQYWMNMWLAECYRVSKYNTPICLFTDWRQLPTMTDALQASGYTWEGVFVWDKKNARPMKGRFKQQTEFVIWGSKGGLNIKRDVGYLHGIASISPQKGGRHHQTSKPVDLMKTLNEIVEPRGTILDPFMGSGSTGVAAKMQGYKFVGIEITKDYFDVATKRIESTDCKAPCNAER